MKRQGTRKQAQRTSLWLAVCAATGAGAQSNDLPVTVLSTVEVVSQPVEFRQFERVEITGSSIIRKEQTQTLPVQIVTRAEIQRSGKHSVADYLQTLPVMSNGISPAAVGGIRSLDRHPQSV